jgi:hypothetical protein
MLFLEIFVRRLDAETLKTKVTKTLYGDSTAQNELTKFLISTADDAKSQKIPKFEERCADLTPQI